MRGYFSTYIDRYWKTEKQKTYIEIVWTLILLIALVVFALRPGALTLYNLLNTRSEGEKANKVLDKRLRDLSLAQATFNRISNDLSLLDKMIPAQPQILDFLNNLNALAAFHSLGVTDISYQGGELVVQTGNSSVGNVKDPASNINFILKVSGSYANLRSFIVDLDKFIRLSRVETFDLIQQETSDNIDLVITGKAFWLPAKAGLNLSSQKP